VYVGIKELKQFAVFNRWGQIIFSTNDRQKGWDGKDWPVETYVWMVQAIDASNQPLTLKGIVTLIR
ncbi:MAG TPA: gliding motility-associated C-terminal domain-containing protein, partial [Flavisolibacter sp.]|nr:gliding motility-associated C-terminal domain-containing protein [Flavisolibacter sp.]